MSNHKLFSHIGAYPPQVFFILSIMILIIYLLFLLSITVPISLRIFWYILIFPFISTSSIFTTLKIYNFTPFFRWSWKTESRVFPKKKREEGKLIFNKIFTKKVFFEFLVFFFSESLGYSSLYLFSKHTYRDIEIFVFTT